MPIVKLYLTAMAIFLVIDLAWIGWIARGFYQVRLGYILAPSPNWAAAVVFYLMFIAGLLVFVVLPGLRQSSAGPALVRALLYGAVTYGTYGLTNLAVVREWPVLVTVVDMVWGIVLSTLVSLGTIAAGRRFVRSGAVPGNRQGDAD